MPIKHSETRHSMSFFTSKVRFLSFLPVGGDTHRRLNNLAVCHSDAGGIISFVVRET